MFTKSNNLSLLPVLFYVVINSRSVGKLLSYVRLCALLVLTLVLKNQGSLGF